MGISYRRFEVLLPLQFNDGTDIPDELFGETLLEIRQRFGAVSHETQRIQGTWMHGGQIYRDQLIRVFVDVPDTKRNMKFFSDLKRVLRDRFKQLDIWLVHFPIDVI